MKSLCAIVEVPTQLDGDSSVCVESDDLCGAARIDVLIQPCGVII